MTVNEDLSLRRFTTTDPYDPTDLPRFGQLTETTKDVFRKELETFFDYKTSDAANKLQEAPNIQKFAMGAGTGEQSLETVVKMLMSYGDKEDQFPMIAITSSHEREKPLSIGNNFVGHFQYPPRVNGSKVGPFNLTDGWELKITTWPLGTVESAVESTIVMSSLLFPDLSNATIDDVLKAINEVQALYYTAEATPEGYLRLRTGGICAKPTPNYIEITGGDTECLNAFGFTLGQSQTYSDITPVNKYYISSDMTINIDVVADSINTRAELTDLVFQFFSYYIEKRLFQFIGRSYQSENIDPEEWWHIILNRQFSWSGELATPRAGGPQRDHIYANRGSVPITSIDYIDKRVGSNYIIERENVIREPNLPAGDYFSNNYIKTS